MSLRIKVGRIASSPTLALHAEMAGRLEFRGSSSYLTAFYVVMESGSGVRFHAIPRGPEATEAMEAGKTRAQLPPAESVLDQAAEADRVELGD